MFVRNHFTNDARVTREAKTLVEQGYEVWVIAVHQENNSLLPKQETKDGIHIFRISRYGILYFIPKYLKSLRQKVLDLFSLKKISGQDELSLVKELFSLILKIIYHIAMMFMHVLKFFTLFFEYLIAKLTRSYLNLIFAFTILTLKFIEQGLKVKADVYHAHDLDTLLAGYVCSRIRRAKLIYDSHEIATDKTGLKARFFWRLLERTLINKADRVIFTTFTRANFTARKYRIKLPEVVSNCTDNHEMVRQVDLRELLSIDRKLKIVLYQGGIQVGRGLEQLVEAVPFLNPGAVVVLVGGGRIKPFLEEKVNLLGLTERVKFTGLVPLDDLLAYTACADVGLQILQNICFNHFSTDSNKLFEYLTVGVPVVASDFPEIRKVIQEFDAGILIDPHKPENIAAGINQMLSDENRRLKMSDNAKMASLKYNWANEKQKLIDIYKFLENGKNN